ncbi:hypothetical protein ABVC47_00815 [Fannyhessea vaginae]|uniref:hypothetical protein n=1 Tax=Fannyhessea vaginae TaxID=82135 RepID=UPI00336A9626
MFRTQQSSTRALMPSVSRVSSQDKRAKKTYYKLIAACAGLGLCSCACVLGAALLFGQAPSLSAHSTESTDAPQSQSAQAPSAKSSQSKVGNLWFQRTNNAAIPSPLSAQDADELIRALDSYNTIHRPELVSKTVLIKSCKQVTQKKGDSTAEIVIAEIGFKDSDAILHAQQQNNSWQVWQDQATGTSTRANVSSTSTTAALLSDKTALKSKGVPTHCAEYLATSFSNWAQAHNLSADQSKAALAGEATRSDSSGAWIFTITSCEGACVHCEYDESANTLSFNQ